MSGARILHFKEIQTIDRGAEIYSTPLNRGGHWGLFLLQRHDHLPAKSVHCGAYPQHR